MLNNPTNAIDPFGLDTISVNNITQSVWHNFDPSDDNIALDEVSITARKGASKAKSAYNRVVNEGQNNYRRSTANLFIGYPDRLRSDANDLFYERYINHSEINLFTGEAELLVWKM